VIEFAVIFLPVGLFFVVLLFTTKMIMALIVLMAAGVSTFVAVALVTSMVVTVLATMMSVVWVTAASDGKMSHLLLFWLLLLLELVKDTGRFVGSLTLLE
jgi:hypothetical protein